jgi:hypothetical protein
MPLKRASASLSEISMPAFMKTILEQAVQIAEDCPGFKFGQTVEVRTIFPDLSEREK